MTNEILETTPESEIVSTRIFNCNREIMYEAWSNPEHLKTWWGPKSFTNTFNEFDFRPNGKWRFIMHGPEKGNYVNECTFIKIIPLKLIAWNRSSQPLFQVVATFEEVTKNKTKLVFKMKFETVNECNKLKPFVVDKNEENFDKLEVVLQKILNLKK